MIDIYTINMDKHTERKSRIESYSREIDAIFTFVPAVDGAILDDDYVNSLKEESLRAHGRALSPGEVGCYLSHISALKLFYETGKNFAIISEDDIVFNTNFESVINKILGNYSNEFDLLLLGYRNGYGSFWGKRLISDIEIFRFPDCGYGAHGYLISREGALKILSNASTPIWPFDYVTGGFYIKKLRVYGLSEKIIELDEVTSNNSSLECERNENGVTSRDKMGVIMFSWFRKLIKQMMPVRNYES
ncbi:glycosyltransferase family 25 protein [Grimontia sp. SpTr1]|uniref:glycosyltransferase family 25 protein n=1 Tax=Grimontia sp. SpTr1 TaxID=2995319 RepID=UPI00248C2887|nr:glycosyltransferase family 25 protein [Grimontia sp. SpTr1]